MIVFVIHQTTDRKYCQLTHLLFQHIALMIEILLSCIIRVDLI